MQTRKIILFIVEGISDQTALALILSRIITDKNVRFHIIGGDITSNRHTTPANAVKQIYQEVKRFLDNNRFQTADISKIVHVIDMDGVYVDDQLVVENNDIQKIIYKENQIETNRLDLTIKRNKNKSAVLDKLSITARVNRIPYLPIYFSCNMEHVLHNRQNVQVDKKEELAQTFIDRYYGREEDFVVYMREGEFSVNGTVKQTWAFIKEDNHSLNRYSNFRLIFDEEESEPVNGG